MKTQPFVIFFQGRSGSTLLASLLGAHPDIVCRFEDFDVVGPTKIRRRLTRLSGRPKNNPSIDDTLEHLQQIFSSPVRAAGFKFKYPYQYGRYPEIFLELFRRRDELKVIHLDRANLVKRAISMQHLLKLRDKVQLVSGNLVRAAGDDKFEVDTNRVLKFIANETQQREELKHILSKFPQVLTIEYDELFKNQLRCLAEISQYFGVSPFPDVQSCFKKATPDHLPGIVANYDELCQALSGTEYARWLDPTDGQPDKALEATATDSDDPWLPPNKPR